MVLARKYFLTPRLSREILSRIKFRFEDKLEYVDELWTCEFTMPITYGRIRRYNIRSRQYT